MSPSPDDPRADLHVRALDELPSLALGEAVPDEVAHHIATCTECRAELASYRAVVTSARAGVSTGTPAPPPTVWDRIEADVRADGRATTSVAAPVVPLQPRPSRRRTALLAAAAAVALGVGVGGYAIGRSGTTSGPSVAMRATLAAQPGTSAAAHGTAVVHPSDDGYRIDLDTGNLPAPSGYYEVWLFDPSIGQMVAIGTLGTGARGSFTVPAGLDMSAYHVVDVSAQRFDGNPVHQRSVLRGSLTQS